MNNEMDYLPNTNIKLFQQDGFFKFNSDTKYLGEFIFLRKNDSVIDVGTNNGVLLLYASIQTKGNLIGIDISKEALEVANRNFKINNIQNYQLYCVRFQDFNMKPVDAIICNPPFFDNLILSKEENLKRAKHNVYLSVEEVIMKAQNLLKDKGKIFMVNRANNLASIIYLLNKYHFGVRRVKFVHDQNKEKAITVLIEAAKNKKNDVIVEKPIIVERK